MCRRNHSHCRDLHATMVRVRAPEAIPTPELPIDLAAVDPALSCHHGEDAATVVAGGGHG